MKIGDHVIVETARGVEFGRVVLGPKEVGEDEVVHPLKEVLRVATQADEDREKQNRLKEKDAFKICQKKIREHGLEMKLIDAEYTFDNNKVLFYFTADGRIDFRQLVKDLAAIFKTRIELRQIGVRDETKILGGIGICGRCLPACCECIRGECLGLSSSTGCRGGRPTPYSLSPFSRRRRFVHSRLLPIQGRWLRQLLFCSSWFILTSLVVYKLVLIQYVYKCSDSEMDICSLS